MSMLLDAALTVCALAVAVAVRPGLSELPFVRPYTPYGGVTSVLYAVVPALWGIVFLLTSVYDPKKIYKLIDELQAVTLAIAFASLVFAGLLFLSSLRGMSRWLFVFFVLFDFLFLVGWRLIARAIFRLGRFSGARQLVLVVGAGKEARQVAQMVEEYSWTGLEFVGFLDDHEPAQATTKPVLGRIDQVREIVQSHKIDNIVLALPKEQYNRINKLVVTLHDLPVRVRVVPDYYSLALYRAKAEEFGGLPMISLRDPALNDYQRLIKRLVDLGLGTLSLVLAAPVFIIVAGAIKLTSEGPVFFKQQRVGENGRLFTMYKFRSMIVGADKMQQQVNRVDAHGQIIHKQANDPRITRVGRFIRRTSLDELPQLLNVIKGDMSLVGPRPELPWLAAQYEPWQRKRFSVPQGITGWWQVNGRSDKPMHLHTEDDLYYVQNYSLWMDIYILLKTLWVVLRGKGAY
ncbi:MAG: sugar transferase [Anaerolineales bacterium]|nr:sugar transferase [Anaerolineales bacterium]